EVAQFLQGGVQLVALRSRLLREVVRGGRGLDLGGEWLVLDRGEGLAIGDRTEGEHEGAEERHHGSTVSHEHLPHRTPPVTPVTLPAGRSTHRPARSPGVAKVECARSLGPLTFSNPRTVVTVDLMEYQAKELFA